MERQCEQLAEQAPQLLEEGHQVAASEVAGV
jgi:hypothetical protein